MNLIKVLLLCCALPGALSAAAAPFTLTNEDISAGDCEKDCMRFVLVADEVIFVWKGAEQPKLFLPFGNRNDGPNADSLPDLLGDIVPIPGELNTDDCVASCEKELLVADLELTARRDDDGHISAIWVREVHYGGIHKRAKVMRGFPSAALDPNQSAALDVGVSQSCTGSGGTGPGDGECRERRVMDVHSTRCIVDGGISWLVMVGEWLTVDCVGTILGQETFTYRMPVVSPYVTCP